MSSTSRILIVTPTLGRSPYLPHCVKLIEDLNLNVLHVLSCPAPMVDEMQARFKSCRVVPDSGRAGGMYEAINCGIKAGAAETNYFTYINDDDELAPGFAEMCRTFATPENESKVGYGDTRHIDAEGKSLGLIATENKQSHFIPLIISRVYPLTQQGMLVGSQVLKAVGYFDSKYRHVADLDFGLRCIRGGFEFRYHPFEVARFRIHAGQLSSSRDEVHGEYAILHGRLKEIRISPARRMLIIARFRLRNIPRYIERYRAIGWMSTEEMTGKPLSSRLG